VLLVDDDPAVREALAAMLEDLGCGVVTAETGFEALEQIRRNPHIEILITDINMPGMDGRELARRAKKLRDDLHVMLLSGRERGRDGFPLIGKPFSEDDLADAIRRATGRTC
jgi:CheY-like chemotaxis protein